MTLKEVKDYIQFDKVFSLEEKKFKRDLPKYKSFTLIMQQPESGRADDNIPMIGVVDGDSLVALYVDEKIVTPARIDLFFDENKVRRPAK